jgi:tRNA threonylcarbamoyladenosine biosynthesis protein TsaE
VSLSTRPLLHTESPEQTLAAGESLGNSLRERYPGGVPVLLIGPLGAGKTVLAKGMARSLGVTEPVISPTYTIISEYHGGTAPLYHIDLYRVEGRDQIENLGLEDILSADGYVIVEWGEKLESSVGEEWLAGGPHVRVTLSLAPDGGRDILVEEVPA